MNFRWLNFYPLCMAAMLMLMTAAGEARGDAVTDIENTFKQVKELRNSGKLQQALPIAKQLVTRAEQIAAKNPTLAANCVNELGLVYYDLRQYAAAEPLFKRAAMAFENIGNQPKSLAQVLENLADCYNDQGRYPDAEREFKRVYAIREKLPGPPDVGGARAANRLAFLYEKQGQHAAAGDWFKKALLIVEKCFGAEHAEAATALNNLGISCCRQGRYDAAEPWLKRALVMREKALGAENLDVATSLNNLAVLYYAQGRYAEAEPLYQRALKISEKALGAEHPSVAMSFNNLAELYRDQGRYAEAEPLCQRALKVREKSLGAEHPDTAMSLNNLAELYRAQSRFVEAEPLYQRAVKIREKSLGAEHPDTATSLNNLASLYRDQGRYAEAEPLCQRALKIREKTLGTEHPDTATSLNNLALLFNEQGRYAEAEPLYQRALKIREQALGAEHPAVAASLNNLALLFNEQGRYAEAEPLYQRTLTIEEKALGADHPRVAMSLNNLAALYRNQGRYAEAEPLYQRALKTYEKALGAEHLDVATSLNNLAVLYRDQGRYAEAEPLYQRALKVFEKALGAEHPKVATSLNNLAELYRAQGRYAVAEPLIDRAIGIQARAGVAPGVRYVSYLVRARIAWKLDRREEAIDDLRVAMQLAEQQRGQLSGGSQERAAGFVNFADAFEQMVAWQVELRIPGEALSAIERSRARSLLDDLAASGADLDAGRAPAERESLRQRDAELRQRIAALEQQLKTAPADRQQQLQADLAEARKAVYDHDQNSRSTSPVYRRLVSAGSGPLRLSQVQRRLAANDGLVLVYLLGIEGGYVLAIDQQRAELTELAIDDGVAKTLGVTAGPLTAQRMQTIILGEQTGLAHQLSDPEHAEQATEKLAALWQTLIPPAQRQQLVAGKVKRLLVAPDGPLALLPFETLVTDRSPDVRYLLDTGVPVMYAPSATVIYNLAERAPSWLKKQGETVLAVGDPSYDASAAPTAQGSPGQLTARSRYAVGGGHLARLPHSGTEAGWVRETFDKYGLSTRLLRERQATEAAVRDALPGKQIVHLACHGLVDQSLGNYFGALALTPGGVAGITSDDGFLTLAEICALDLKHCELALLSACETNLGPQQKGEGTWALSRGFLVAGARRVVASNWLVDDEAAATLVSIFCSAIGKGEQAGSPDYAESLQLAKRRIREQEKWKSPYYWGTFVLIGPN